MENNDIPKERIEARAYELYLERGREDGRALEDWLIAEETLRAEEKLKQLFFEETRQPKPAKARTVATGSSSSNG
jgi:hypothetical protein